jgi:hypothetical protein
VGTSVPINNSTTLKAIAYKSGTTDSPVTSVKLHHGQCRLHSLGVYGCPNRDNATAVLAHEQRWESPKPRCNGGFKRRADIVSHDGREQELLLRQSRGWEIIP